MMMPAAAVSAWRRVSSMAGAPLKFLGPFRGQFYQRSSPGATRPVRFQTVRHSHSAICAITSPNSSSAADQTSAETKLAI